jgi:UDP-N-acetylglucosamine acyltransferase
MATTPDGPAARIDPRAIVSPEAVLGEGVEIGPFAIIEAGAVIGAHTRILAHAYVCRGTTLGTDNVIHMNAVIGHEPQDRAYSGAPTRLEMGDRNVIREGCQLHRGTAEGTATLIGDDCYLMANSHVGHNCRVGSGVVMANAAVLGGHAQVGDRAFLSAHSAVHQHTRVGRLAMLQGGAAVSKDVPPFCMTRHGTNTLAGINVVGLKRAGFERVQIMSIRRVYRTLFLHRPNLSLARERLLAEERAAGGPSDVVQEMLDFIATAKHGVCAGGRSADADGGD